MWPACEPPEDLGRAYHATYPALGNDPYVGRKLVSLLPQAGARPAGTSQVVLGARAGDPGVE